MNQHLTIRISNHNYERLQEFRKTLVLENTHAEIVNPCSEVNRLDSLIDPAVQLLPAPNSHSPRSEISLKDRNSNNKKTQKKRLARLPPTS